MESTIGGTHVSAGFGCCVSRMTMCRVAFVLMCFAPQLRALIPQVGFASLLLGAILAYISLPVNRLSRSSIFFGAYFIAFGMFGMVVQLLGDALPGMPPPRPLFFYALTTLALVLTGLEITRRYGGGQFVLRVLCVLLVVEIMVVALQFAYMSFGVGLMPSDDAARDLLIEGSYGNPNNVAVVLAMLLMLMVMSDYIRISSLSGTALVIATLAATFVTLSRTALMFVIVFLLVTMLTPGLRRLSTATRIRRVWRVLPMIAMLGAVLLMLQRGGVITDLEDIAVVGRSLDRVATLTEFGQDASVEWRAVVASRLIESLDSLGFGTLSDQNYGEYFQPLDSSLAAINPHSYLVEMAFLFGYPGLFMALVFLAAVVVRIIAVRGCSRLLAVLFGFSVLFFQMVPSSVFPLDIFFLLAVIAGAPNMHGVQRVSPRLLAVPSGAVLQDQLP